MTVNRLGPQKKPSVKVRYRMTSKCLRIPTTCVCTLAKGDLEMTRGFAAEQYRPLSR